MDTADIEKYLYRLKDRNPHTAKRYSLTIKKLREFANEDDSKIDADLVNDFIGQFKKKIRGEMMPTRTSLVYAYAILDMFKFAGRIDKDSIRIPTGILIEDNPPFLYKEDIEELIKHSRGVLKPAIALSHDLALRFGEAVMLERTDFNPSTLKCKVVRIKQRERVLHTLNVSRHTVEVVTDYLSKRRDKQPQLLVTDSHHTPLSINQQKLFPKLCEALGIEDRAGSGKPPTWHILRHTRLTWMIADGKSVEEAAKFAGHKSTASTFKYLNLCTFYGLGKYKVLKAE